MKFKYDYVSRSFSDDKWEFRLLKSSKINTGDKIYQAFYDVDYGGKRKSKLAALAFSGETLSNLPKRVLRRIRYGYPKFKSKSGVYLVTRNGTPDAYIAKVYNKFTGEMAKKSYSFGEGRTQDQALKLAKKFRREQVKIVQQLAIKYGYVEI